MLQVSTNICLSTTAIMIMTLCNYPRYLDMRPGPILEVSLSLASDGFLHRLTGFSWHLPLNGQYHSLISRSEALRSSSSYSPLSLSSLLLTVFRLTSFSSIRRNFKSNVLSRTSSRHQHHSQPSSVLLPSAVCVESSKATTSYKLHLVVSVCPLVTFSQL
ncbi:hypothetical protein BT63DRAFT_457170 [Microthyrium microscopicum]|uniref:Uncharacterized protein n=1 Tax=Microthyrium microscopicum TaxID=703497 RepID=A0A6A6U6I5_9PEZI|nr:hypothetical protein BT63DRAFT_457170 [Microthyrium microscopicum]